MSGTIIITKNSTTTSNPGQGNLQQGELAYSYVSSKLFIGDSSSPVNDIIIGGKHYTDMLDHALGVLTASSAILVDGNKKIDVLNIDNITIDGNTVTTTDANGNLTLDPNGTGNLIVQGDTDIVGNLTVSGTSSFTGQTTLASLNVTDLTAGRVLLAGTAGEVEDSTKLTFNGTTLTVTGNQVTTGNITVNGILDVDTSATIATLKVEDLTSGRVVLGGAGGEIEDSSKLTFNGTTLTVTGNEAITGTLDVNGQATVASLNVEDLTATRLTFAGTSGELVDSGNLTFTGSLLTVTGNEQITGTLNVDSQATLASLNVEDLTSGRITYAGASGELKDSTNFRYDGTTLFVDGAIDVDNIKLDGNVITATDANGSLVIRPSGTGVVTIDTTRALIIASGDELSRPTPLSVGDGAIRYNETDNRFEGTVSGSWTGLGGVVDIDQDTYIVAEESSDDDTLRFYAGGTQEAYVTSAGMWVTDKITVPNATITTAGITTANIGTANVTTQLQVDADANFSVGIDVTAGDVDIADNLNVSGNAIIDGNLTVNGTTTAVNSTVTTLNDPVIKLGDGSGTALDLIDRGVNFDYGDGTAVQTGFFGFDNATNRFTYKLVALAADEADQDYSAPWGDAQFASLFLDNNAAITGTLGVTGATTLSNTLGVTGITTMGGLLNANGGIAVDTNKFTVADGSGNTLIAGTLGVTGATSMSTLSTSGLATLESASITSSIMVGGTLVITGATTLSNTLGVTGASTLSSTLNVVGATDLDSTLNVDGNTTLKGTTTMGVGAGAMLVSAAGVMTHGTIDGGTF